MSIQTSEAEPTRTAGEAPVTATSGEARLASTLRLAVGRLGRRLRAERQVGGLGLSSVSVLGLLEHKGELTVGELAELERVTPPSMTRTVACLVEAGLVDRRQDEDDKRRVLCSLAPAGKEMVSAERARRDAWLASRLAELTAEERALLTSAAPLLERLSTS